jgi:hypothetical protein
MELMLRVELGGAKPAVFPFLPVGTRSELTRLGEPGDDPDCKPSKSAMSLEETWPADDEVVLDGKAAPPSPGTFKIEAIVTAGPTPGRYRFTR